MIDIDEKYPPMTPEEADAAYDAAEPVPISKEEIESLVKSVTVGYQCPRGCIVPISELKHKGTASWQNRWQCPKCGKYFSR